MRIISGKHKGRKINAPKNLPVRPTTDMAKESLFNILRNRIHLSQTKVLDLFAGTGNISYEFASRGSGDITAVDSHINCTRFITQIAKDLELPIQVYKSDVYAYLGRCSEKFNLIFADPPYNFETSEFEKIVNLVMENELLEPEGILIIEHSKHTSLESHSSFVEMRKYGGSIFSFFQAV